MSGTEWVRQIPDDVLEKLWKACLQANHSIQDALGTASYVLADDARLGMARDRDAYQELAFSLNREMERREYEPEEVSA